MVDLGYAPSSEEFPPEKLVSYANAAESAGFKFALISDHFHPWINDQGNSPFVWSVIGAISQVAGQLTLGTGVTCPLMRISPAIVAQAADAGFDHVYVHQIGPAQEQFFQFYTEKVLPKFGTSTKTSNGSARHHRSRGRETGCVGRRWPVIMHQTATQGDRNGKSS
jgi:hypothetical protein